MAAKETETIHNPEVVISALIHNRTTQTLLVGKQIGTLGKGKFDVPHGHLEYGEMFTACAERVVRRETSLEVNARRVVAVEGDVDDSPGRERHYITLFVLCELKSDEDQPEVMEPEKTEEWVWRTWSQLVKEPDREIPLAISKILEENHDLDKLLRRSI